MGGPQLEDTPVTQEGFVRVGEESIAGGHPGEHQNQGPSDPRLSVSPGGTASLGVIGAQCWTSWETGSSATRSQGHSPSGTEAKQANSA